MISFQLSLAQRIRLLNILKTLQKPETIILALLILVLEFVIRFEKNIYFFLPRMALINFFLRASLIPRRNLNSVRSPHLSSSSPISLFTIFWLANAILNWALLLSNIFGSPFSRTHSFNQWIYVVTTFISTLAHYSDEIAIISINDDADGFWETAKLFHFTTCVMNLVGHILIFSMCQINSPVSTAFILFTFYKFIDILKSEAISHLSRIAFCSVILLEIFEKLSEMEDISTEFF